MSAQTTNATSWGEPQAAFWGQPQATGGKPQAGFWAPTRTPLIQRGRCNQPTSSNLLTFTRTRVVPCGTALSSQAPQALSNHLHSAVRLTSARM